MEKGQKATLLKKERKRSLLDPVADVVAKTEYEPVEGVTADALDSVQAAERAALLLKKALDAKKAAQTAKAAKAAKAFTGPTIALRADQIPTPPRASVLKSLLRAHPQQRQQLWLMKRRLL